MTAPATLAPCDWELTGCGCGGGCLDKASPSTGATARDLAVQVMWAATGRRYGLCELTVLPINPGGCADPLYQTFPLRPGWYGQPGADRSGLAVPVLEDGQWFNRCGGGCTCRDSCGAVYLDGPVAAIVDVLLDGVDVDPATYEVHDQTLLVRLDGCWPTCQRFGVDIPGFEVTYLRGTPIPPAVLAGAGELACEYAKLCSGGECRLPGRMRSLTRQGVEVAVLDTPSSKGWLRTGLPLVDAVIEADNPYGLTERPVIMSPDLPAPRRVTWRAGS